MVTVVASVVEEEKEDPELEGSVLQNVPPGGMLPTKAGHIMSVLIGCQQRFRG